MSSMFCNLKKKQIILVRHAKAMERTEWSGTDFDRPLTPAGENSNKIVANYLRLIGVKPDRIVASPSARTKGTAIDLAKKFGIEKKIEYFDELYNENTAPTRDVMAIHMNIAKKTKKDSDVLVIVGHNNDLSDFAAFLSGESVPSMKKGSIVVLSLPECTDWKDIQPGSLKFIYYLTPHFLRLEELA